MEFEEGRFGDRHSNQMASLLVCFGACSSRQVFENTSLMCYYMEDVFPPLLLSHHHSLPSSNAAIPNIAVTEVLLDCSSHKPLPLAVLTGISGYCTPRTPGYPKLGSPRI